jgi:hypothetical protein
VSDQGIAGENRIAETEAALTELEIARTIKALVSKGDKAKEKAEQFYIAAGQHLKTLKKNYSKSWAEWELLLREKCKLGTSRASELMQIADGRKTVEQIRANTAKRVMKHSESSPLANGESSKATTVVPIVPNDDDDSEADYGPQTTGINPPEARRRGLIARTEEALRLANFDDLDGLEIDIKTHLAVMATTAAWSQLLDRSGARTVDSPAIAPTPAADIDLEIPAFLKRTAVAS